MEIGLGQRTQTLIERITTSRAAKLDEITAARMGELDSGNIPSDVDSLLARLTGARAGYLDNLNIGETVPTQAQVNAQVDSALNTAIPGTPTAGSINERIAALDDNYTTTRAAKLDNLDALISSRSSHNATNVRQSVTSGSDPANSIGRRIYDNLDAAVSSRSAHVAADIWGVVARTLTNPAGASDLANMQTGISATATGRAAKLDEITAARLAELDSANIPTDIDTLLTRLTGTRAGYLDNLVGTQTAATYSHPSGTTEQDAVVITPSEMGKYEKLVLDLNGLSQDTTVRTFVQVDGSNYRQIDSAVFPDDFPSGAEGAVIDLTPGSRTTKVTLQSSIAEGASVDVPYFYVKRSLA